MGYERIGSIPEAPKGQCRGCNGPVPKRRRNWCSDPCVTAALIRKGDPNTVRREVKKRDHEICSSCGLDCAQAQRVIARLNPNRWPPTTNEDRESRAAARRFLMQLWTGHVRAGGSLWQADHIVPVVEGGGGCDLDGYRTLCVKCHKGETAALAKRRALQRQTDIRPLLSEARS